MGFVMCVGVGGRMMVIFGVVGGVVMESISVNNYFGNFQFSNVKRGSAAIFNTWSS